VQVSTPSIEVLCTRASNFGIPFKTRDFCCCRAI